MIKCARTNPNAHVAELVDALVSGSSDESRGGSSPLVRILNNEGVTIKSNSLLLLGSILKNCPKTPKK